jgi:SAM-dependent methyltransferase
VNYWNEAGREKPFSVPIDIDRLNTWLSPHSRIADIGCGYGRVLPLLRDAGFRNLAGVDPAPAMIASARERVPEAELLVMHDPAVVPMADASLDAALVIGVLTAIPSDQGQRTLLSECARVLTPGGLLCLADFWIQHDERNRVRYEQGLARHGVWGVFDLPEGVTLRHHSPERLAELTAGFERLALEDIVLTTMNGHQARGFRWYGRRTTRPA